MCSPLAARSFELRRKSEDGLLKSFREWVRSVDSP